MASGYAFSQSIVTCRPLTGRERALLTALRDFTDALATPPER
jgi:hypothetical protein